MLGEYPAMCHPERRGISPLSGEMERSRTFAGRGCDISQRVAKWRTAASKSANIRQRRMCSGICDGFPQCLLSLSCIFHASHTAHFQILLCANKRVINRSQIPSSSVRCTNSSVLDRLAAIVPLPLQNFDFAPFHRSAVKVSLRSG